jgi:hypothetical protein
MAAKKSKRSKKGTRAAKATKKPSRARALAASPGTRGGGSPKGAYARALGVASEKAKSVRARIAEVEKLANGVCDDEGVFKGVLELLQDTSEPTELRRAALRTLQAASFSVVAFNARRAEYLAALRAVTEDPDPEIRQSVLGILARERDGHAQQLLLEGLEDPDRALVAPEKALQLLSYDVHAEAYPVARKIVKRPPTPEAKREALRLLGADAGSVALFESVLRDKKESPELRRISASALQTLKPASLREHAREIVLDDDEDDEVKATGLAALSQFGTEEVARDEELRTKTSKLKSAGSAAVKRGAKAFLAKYHRE